MSILGSDFEEYLKYTEKVRKEYSSFTDEEFRTGRLAFLKTIKDKDVFRHPLFVGLNQQARDNIAREIELLEHQH